jgi:hypothetical protein
VRGRAGGTADAADAGMYTYETNRFIFISSADVVVRCGTDATDVESRGSATHEHIGRTSVGYIAWKLLIARAASTTSAIPAPGRAQ